MFFDSHVHFEALEGEYGLSSVINRAEKAGVRKITAVGGSYEINNLALTAAVKFPDTVFPAIGYDRELAGELFSLCEQDHSNNQEELLEPFISKLQEDINSFKRNNLMLKSTSSEKGYKDHLISAIGEIGLDFYYNKNTSEIQLMLLGKQLELARSLKLPVIIHSREADKETVYALSKHSESWNGEPDRIGVIHCFTGSEKFAMQMIDLGFYIGFSGIITFKNASDLRDIVKLIPEDRLLIETDSPYLTPVPFRGRKNEPAYIKYIAEALAEIKGLSVDDIAYITAENAQRLFTGSE